MKIKEFLESLKDGNKLKEYVLDYYIDDYNNYTDELSFIKEFEELQRNGCVTGMIKTLIYYDETNEFYDEYQNEINELLSNFMNNTGLSMNELFGDKFDETDPLILNYINKNLLAWFGFEQTAYLIYQKICEKINTNEFIY